MTDLFPIVTRSCFITVLCVIAEIVIPDFIVPYGQFIVKTYMYEDKESLLFT